MKKTQPLPPGSILIPDKMNKHSCIQHYMYHIVCFDNCSDHQFYYTTTSVNCTTRNGHLVYSIGNFTLYQTKPQITEQLIHACVYVCVYSTCTCILSKIDFKVKSQPTVIQQWKLITTMVFYKAYIQLQFNLLFTQYINVNTNESKSLLSLLTSKYIK